MKPANTIFPFIIDVFKDRLLMLYRQLTSTGMQKL